MAKKETKEEDTPVANAHTAETPEQVMAIAAQNVAQAVTAPLQGLQQSVPRSAMRRELPKIRNSKTFKFTVGGTSADASVVKLQTVPVVVPVELTSSMRQ